MEEKSSKVSNIIDNIRRVFQVVHGHSKKAERETGLTSPQLWAIKVIFEVGSLRVCDLARRMYLHPATTVGILDRLEKKGLVSRVRSREDRRVVNVELTPEGREMVEKSPEVAQGLLVTGLEKLSATNLKKIDDSLMQMVKILGAQEIPAKLILSADVNHPEELMRKGCGRKRTVVS